MVRHWPKLPKLSDTPPVDEPGTDHQPDHPDHGQRTDHHGKTGDDGEPASTPHDGGVHHDHQGPVTAAEIRAAFTAERPFPAGSVPVEPRSTRSTPAARCSSRRRPDRARRSSPSTRSRARSPRAAKAFYTTPLKALSNQKYGDFVRAYGAERVGLLTGDNAINGDAPVVVMTTEVLRNMIYAGSPTLHGLRYVVLDEVHYLQDPSRGAVWEEVIIHLPTEIDIVALSATVSNAEEVAAWMQTVRGATETVIEERRPVELVHLYLVGDRERARRCTCCRRSSTTTASLRPNPVATRLDGRNVPDRGQRRRRLYKPWRTEVVERLAEERMLPAIDFVFSRTGLRPGGRAVSRLRDPAHRRGRAPRAARASRSATSSRCRTTTSTCSATTCGSRGWRPGVAAHHAGLVPPMKEAVEEGFSTGTPEGRVRDRDACARHQHAGAVGRHREALEVHG